jgi:Sulfotransferase family
MPGSVKFFPMGWKELVNSGLSRTAGYQLTRPPGHPSRRLPPPTGDRMLRAPVFILSPARSGSTLLRVVLGSHSRLYAPPELPLMHMTVRAETRWIQTSMRELELTQESLDNTLWDAVLADVLARSGKPVVVAKTPSNAVIWQRIADCWPDARFIFLLRHPAAVVGSLLASWHPDWNIKVSGTLGDITRNALWYMRKVEEARRALAGITVRYEELTEDPEQVTRRVCEYLGERFEPAMLDYSKFSHARFAPGLGDCSENIRSGRIRQSAPPPRLAEVSPALAEMCATWDYSQPGTGSESGTGTQAYTGTQQGTGARPGSGLDGESLPESSPADAVSPPTR